MHFRSPFELGVLKMRIVLKLFIIVGAFAGLPASAADWYLAETEHFSIYSRDDKKSTEEFARDLERLDEVLRIISGVGPDDGSLPPSSKVTVFRFGQTKDIGPLIGDNRGMVGGFFIPRATGSFAFVPVRENRTYGRSNQDRMQGLGLEPKAVLYHEYVHYFMYQHRNAPYPAWYREGFAELFSTLRIDDDRFVIGDTPTWRSTGIMMLDVDVEEMFAPGKPTRETMDRTYSHGWLLASFLNFTPERRPQITDYIVRLARGEDRLEAAKAAFGDLDQLEKELKTYRTGAAKVISAPFMYKEEPKVAIRKLGADEEAVIDLVIRSKVGVDEDQAAKQLPQARTLVAAYPSSMPVLLAAMEVEFDNKNYAESEALARKVQAIDPTSSEAAINLAYTAFMQSADDRSMLLEARDRFIAANNLENDHPSPLFGYYLTYLFADEAPTSDAKAALESAYQYAPFDVPIRMTLAHMFLVEGEFGITKSLLNPLIQQAHGSNQARCIAYEIGLYENGDTQPLIDRLKPEHPGAEKDETEEEAQESCGGEEDEKA